MKVLIGPNGDMDLENSIPELSDQFPDVEFLVSTSYVEATQQVVDVDIMVGWINQAILEAAKNLKWIQSISSGTNYYLNIPGLVDSDILLTSASGTHGACLAESAMGMIFAFTRGIRKCIQSQNTRQWSEHRYIRGNMKELTGSTMGIVGFGASGRALARRAFAFDMRIVAVDMLPIDKPEYVDHLWGIDQLSDLLQTSDYVVIMAPYTDQTKAMIGTEELAEMKTSAMLVIMSRGGIVDQDALAKTLKNGHLFAAASDVFSPEPLSANSDLWDLENMLITPHIAGGTQLEGQYVTQIFFENLKRFVRGDYELKNLVHKKRGF